MSYKDLLVWQKSMDLIPSIYNVSASLPSAESFGLRSQIQRSCVSIPSNIAEGSKRSSRTEFRQFCLISLGSAAELETQLLVISRLYPNIEVQQELKIVNDIQKMLNKLVKRLKEPVSPLKTDNGQRKTS